MNVSWQSSTFPSTSLSISPSAEQIYQYCQPMQTVQMQQAPNKTDNSTYTVTAKNFFDQYSLMLALGINCTNNFYGTPSLCSLHIHQGENHQLYELNGYENFRNKLNELGITTIKLVNSHTTPQPLGKKTVLLSVLGQADINQRRYNISMVFTLRSINGTMKILNQILEIIF
jgi:hypothetical protein